MSQRSRANPWWGPRGTHWWATCKRCWDPFPSFAVLLRRGPWSIQGCHLFRVPMTISIYPARPRSRWETCRYHLRPYIHRLLYTLGARRVKITASIPPTHRL